jgi:hypothetical protein
MKQSEEMARGSSVSPFALAEDCGRLFEVGFNVGILTYIRQHEQCFSTAFGTIYDDYLRQLSFPDMLKNVYKRNRFSTAIYKRKVARQWFLFFLQKGFLSGLNFFQEFHQSLGWDEEVAKITIAYYQCSFCGDNSIYTNNISKEEEYLQILSQLKNYGIDPARINTQQHDKKDIFCMPTR